jgi:Tfp pilus assembly PilM family ATPase
MSQYLAIEWDTTEARVCIARVRGKDATIEHAFAVPLGTADNTAGGAGRAIADALQIRRVGRVETLVAIGRASIEFRQLSLPPCPPDEMPEMVRFQAQRQFTTIGEDWPLDFIPLESDEAPVEGTAEAVSLLAAAIAPELVAQIRATCQGAQLTPQRLILRPFAAASLLRRHSRGTDHPCRLMVDLLPEEVDLTVLDERQVRLMRTVRLPSAEDATVQARSLLGEIRRTIAAASNQLHGRRVERIVLCGSRDDHAALKSLIESELALPVDLFNPFDGLSLGSAVESEPPRHAGRFAPLLGMLVDEAAGAPHAIDFLHPRKKPEPVNTRRRKLLIAATLTTAVLAAGLLVMIELDSLDSEIMRLRSQINSMKSKVAIAEKQKKNTAMVQEFVDSDLNWLEEMSSMSQRLPPPEDMLVVHVSAGTRLPSGGEITLTGFARTQELLGEIQTQLRAGNRKVISKGGYLDPRREKEKLRWRFDETVLVDPGVQVEVSSTPSPGDVQRAVETAQKSTGSSSK